MVFQYLVFFFFFLTGSPSTPWYYWTCWKFEYPDITGESIATAATKKAHS